jgi:hypothetical protein
VRAEGGYLFSASDASSGQAGRGLNLHCVNYDWHERRDTPRLITSTVETVHMQQRRVLSPSGSGVDSDSDSAIENGEGRSARKKRLSV